MLMNFFEWTGTIDHANARAELCCSYQLPSQLLRPESTHDAEPAFFFWDLEGLNFDLEGYECHGSHCQIRHKEKPIFSSRKYLTFRVSNLLEYLRMPNSRDLTT